MKHSEQMRHSDDVLNLKKDKNKYKYSLLKIHVYYETSENIHIMYTNFAFVYLYTYQIIYNLKLILNLLYTMIPNNSSTINSAFFKLYLMKY